MMAPAAPHTTAPMMAPFAVEPLLLPIAPPTAAPVVAPMMAPFSLLLSDAQAGSSASPSASGARRTDGRETGGCTRASNREVRSVVHARAAVVAGCSRGGLQMLAGVVPA